MTNQLNENASRCSWRMKKLRWLCWDVSVVMSWCVLVPCQSQYSSQERLHLGAAVTPEHSPATPSSSTRSRQHHDSSDSGTPHVEAELADIPSNSSSNSSGVRSPLIRPRSHSLRSVESLMLCSHYPCLRNVWTGHATAGRHGRRFGHPCVRSFLPYCGRGPAYSWPHRSELFVGPVRQPREMRGIGRCVLFMCALCRVEEGLSRREQLVGYF